GSIGILGHGVISLAVAAAGWVGGCSPGDYAAFKFPPTPRHDRASNLRSHCNIQSWYRFRVSAELREQFNLI
ncbi:hypothetical protein AAFO90_23215, partial [Phaeobacter sp. CAU 1743]|uniref:hypothetical protein n=1 Tax=Phaeobacter sp. CAU 1743 TaxID=3140367 RepID=UPI00325A6A3E